ncbi:MAG: hypothetical protein ACKVPX_17815 [Myxococcaceae bacterium]
MAQTNKIDPTAVRMSTTVTVDRKTPDRGFGARVHLGLNQAASTLVGAAGIAGQMMPALPIVSAAIAQVGNLGGAPGTTISQTVGGQYSGVGTAATLASLNGAPGLIPSSISHASGPISGATGFAGSSNLIGLTPQTSSVTAGGVMSGVPNLQVPNTGGATGAGYQNEFAALGTEQHRLLQMQIAMQRENQFFTSLSNVLKTRHDTAKAAISNIR